MTKTTFQLDILKLGDTCYFKLSGERGLTISVQLNYPTAITQLYEKWRKSYLSYYQQLRGRVKGSGVARLKEVDCRGDLVQEEARLLDQFHYWLRSPELTPITRKIAQASLVEDCQRVEIFITCSSKQLARLPWETWEIGTHLGTKGKIYIARSPANINNESVHPIRRKPRILAIFGDDTGLDLKTDKEELKSLFGKDVVKFVGWKQGDKNGDDLKQKIVREIADEQGWDILFFAGHSNEGLGGELSIAPNTSIFIEEIEPALKIAKERGLQFAIFNSCSGIDLAQSLIDLGLNQVIIFREPIHNKVAQEFSKQFFRSLAQYKDVNESMVDACQFLKQQEKVLIYPSAYSIPSLFRHPEAELFKIRPFTIWDLMKRWLPNSREALWLIAFLILSLVPHTQSLLLNYRLLFQSLYRQITWQSPKKQEPPVLLIQIDETSIEKAKIPFKERNPLNRDYISQILNKSLAYNPSVVGVDYKFWEPTKISDDEKLGDVIRNGVRQKTWWVLAGKLNEAQTEEVQVIPETIANLNWSLQGQIYFFDSPTFYVELLAEGDTCLKSCPFAYLLAISSQLSQKSPNRLQPQLNSDYDFRESIIKIFQNLNLNDKTTEFLQRSRLPIITKISYTFNQAWLHPIIDFSIPPNRAYQSVPAWCLLKPNSTCPNLDERRIQQQIVLLAPGGYENADDNFSIPLAVKFWRGGSDRKFTGGEVHAYMIHHFLRRRLVVPIPDLWMVLLAALLGKGTILFLQDNPKKKKPWIKKLALATVAYSLIVLQGYISAAILLPLLFPSVVFWNYIRFTLRSKFP